MEVAFRYECPPGGRELGALKEVRAVYGILRISFDEPRRIIHVEYDATRLTVDDIAFLLRNAGFKLLEQVPVVPPSQPLAA